MSRALVGVLFDGPADPSKAHAPQPNPAARTTPAPTTAIIRLTDTAGRAACVADPVGGPVTVWRARNGAI